MEKLSPEEKLALFKSRKKDADEMFRVVFGRYASYGDGWSSDKFDSISGLAEVGKYQLEILDEIERTDKKIKKSKGIYSVSEEKEYLTKAIDELKKKVYDDAVPDGLLNLSASMFENVYNRYMVRGDRDGFKNYPVEVTKALAEVGEFEIEVILKLNEYEDRLEEIDVSPRAKKTEEEKKEALASKKSFAVNKLKIANEMFRHSSDILESASWSYEALETLAEVGKYRNTLNDYIDRIDRESAERGFEKLSQEDKINLLVKRRESVKDELKKANSIFKTVSYVNESVGGGNPDVMTRIATVGEYRYDLIKRLEKTEDLIEKNGGTIDSSYRDDLDNSIEAASEDLSKANKFFKVSKYRYDGQAFTSDYVEVSVDLAEIGSYVISLERRLEIYNDIVRTTPKEDKKVNEEVDNIAEVRVSIGQIEARKQLILEGQDIPLFSELMKEDVPMNPEWAKRGLYGRRYNPMASEFDGMSNQKRQEVLAKRAKELTARLAEQNRLREEQKEAEEKAQGKSNFKEVTPDMIEVRKKLILQGQDVPTFSDLEKSKPVPEWEKMGLYGKKDYLVSEFAGVSDEKRREIIAKRAKELTARLKAQGNTPATDYFNRKL